jgi:dynein heavy chain 1, cytosolic
MNPSQDGLKNLAVTSPALFNRCVLNWFGDWSYHAYYQVGKELTLKINLEKANYMAPDKFQTRSYIQAASIYAITHREAVIETFVQIHDTLHQANRKLQKKGVRTTTITRTSFLDNAFRKNLESALLFGNPMLIEDVENYDPILNPVLNREIRRTDGRVLITLGDQDIDFSPMFTMFLSSRDPTVEFPPDICSRVTFVNFTVTRASLQAQCLHQVLKCERPHVEEKRLDLLKAQDEFQQRFRHLEEDLLCSLNESKGKILNDDSIITRLENLKKKMAETSRKVTETDQVMKKEVENDAIQYVSLSQACSSIYFTMDVLNQIHNNYQYSLQYFLEIFNTVLTQNNNLEKIKDLQKRVKIIAKDLFYLAYYRVARGMLYQDRIVLAILLARIYLKCFYPTNPTEIADIESNFRLLMSSFSSGLSKEVDNKLNKHHNKLNHEQSDALQHLIKVNSFSKLRPLINQNLKEFFEWIDSANPEASIPESYLNNEGDSSAQQASANAELKQIKANLKKLLLIKAFRPDRFISIAEMFVALIFGEEFMQQPQKLLDLAYIVENEIKCNTPVLMCSVSGYDASGLVEDLATEMNKPLVSIAIGSAEGFTQVDKAINTASKNGKWVLLKNVHLATQWLVQLEKNCIRYKRIFHSKYFYRRKSIKRYLVIYFA